MNYRFCLSILICLIMTVSVTHASEPSEGNDLKKYKSAHLALEKEWKTTPHISYFGKMVQLSREALSLPIVDVDFHNFQLDLVSDMFLKSCYGSTMGAHPDVIGSKSYVIHKLSSINIKRIKDMPFWSKFRSRYARLMMLQRATCFMLLDSTLDDKSIVLDNTCPASAFESDPTKRAALVAVEEADRKKLEIQNRKVSAQIQVKKFMKETAPVIDRFMIATFSNKPDDLRMLNEFLALGFYTPAEQTKLVALVKAKVQKSDKK